MAVCLLGVSYLACLYVAKRSTVQVITPLAQQSASVQCIKAVSSQCLFLLEIRDIAYVLKAFFSATC